MQSLLQFILEQLCNLICMLEPEVVYHLILNKAYNQEEFIRGLMTKNPYFSGEIDPLMRDVKNKICNQLDLLGLIEDDCGDDGRIWSNAQSFSMKTSFKYPNYGINLVGPNYQGLDGEATERMIKELDEDREEGPRSRSGVCYRKCSSGMYQAGNSFGDCLGRLRDDLKSNQEQLVAVLNLLMLCCKIRENKRVLLRLGALILLLEIARRAFSVDAIEPAEGILLIVESLTMEANESDNINIAHNALTVSNEEAGAGEQAKKIPAAMEALCQHFDPYLKNWVEFDQLLKQNLENPKDETVSPQASKQRFAVENFVMVSDSMKTSSCGERLKDIILENGITEVAVRHLKDSFVFRGEAGFKSSPEWHSGLKLPPVPLILSMLRGLPMGHLATQKCIDEGGILSLLHVGLQYVKQTLNTHFVKQTSLYLNCPNLSELNLNSCKALLPVLQSSKLESVHAVGCPDVVVQAIQTQVN
ncbi:auxin transport protein BIG [Tanacetum coccineum]